VVRNFLNVKAMHEVIICPRTCSARSPVPWELGASSSLPIQWLTCHMVLHFPRRIL